MNDIAYEDFLFFVTFAEAKNSIEAAQRLGVSQPTLTERLRSFEAKLPSSPFTWAGKKKILNAYGEQLLSIVKPKLNEVQATLRDAVQMGASNAAFRMTIAGRQEVLSRLMNGFECEGQVHLKPATSAEATQQVLSGRADIAITRERIGTAEVVCQKLFESQLALVFSKEGLGLSWKDLPQPNSKQWQQLVGKPYIAYTKPDPLLRDFLLAYALEETRIDTRIVCENWMIVKELILQGRGYTILPLEIIHGDTRFTAFPLSLPKITHSIFYLIYRKNFTKSELGKRTIARIKASFNL